MSITQEKKQSLIADYRRDEHDVGSPAVQIAIMTERIRNLTEHAKQNKHDQHSKRGLLRLVGQRKRMMRYMNRTDHAAYRALIASLGIRG
jgi:small subunit ribosomal protein S15